MERHGHFVLESLSWDSSSAINGVVTVDGTEVTAAGSYSGNIVVTPLASDDSDTSEDTGGADTPDENIPAEPPTSSADDTSDDTTEPETNTDEMDNTAETTEPDEPLADESLTDQSDNADEANDAEIDTAEEPAESEAESAPEPTATPVPIPGEAGDHTLGDVNGDGTVNITDVQTLLKYVNGQDVYVVPGSPDVSGDGVVNISDVQLLLKFVNGQDVSIS